MENKNKRNLLSIVFALVAFLIAAQSFATERVMFSVGEKKISSDGTTYLVDIMATMPSTAAWNVAASTVLIQFNPAALSLTTNAVLNFDAALASSTFTEVAINYNYYYCTQTLYGATNLAALNLLAIRPIIAKTGTFRIATMQFNIVDGTQLDGLQFQPTNTEMAVYNSDIIGATGDWNPTPLNYNPTVGGGAITDYTVQQPTSAIVNQTTFNITSLFEGQWTGTAAIPLGVTVELRTGNSTGTGANISITGTTLVQRQPAIMDATGNTTVVFPNLPANDYWIVVRAAGWLPVASSAKVTTTGKSTHTWDFSSSTANVLVPTKMVKASGTRFIVKGGDLNSIAGGGGNRGIDASDLSIYNNNKTGNVLTLQIPAANIVTGFKGTFGPTLNITALQEGKWTGTAAVPVGAIVELRSGNSTGTGANISITGTTLVAEQPAVFSTTGTSSVVFPYLPAGDYWVVVRAPGYSALASSAKITFTATGTFSWDFSNLTTNILVPTKMVSTVSGRLVAKGGDLNSIAGGGGNRGIDASDLSVYNGNKTGNVLTLQIPAP
jgi:hypothetical protein